MSGAAIALRADSRDLSGFEIAAVVLVLSSASFLAYLDTTIANVLIPSIAGGLAVSPSNGTWVTTAYAVAEAIMVPLTGWLSERFGPVKVFVLGIFGFGIFSLLCGMATSLGMLIAFRVALGICGGPLIPLSQTLLIKIVPEKNRVVALSAWAMGSVLSPIAGPVLGGLISDHWGWEWAFYFKFPLALALGVVAWRVLAAHEQKTMKASVDFSGLALLVLWVGTLQIMLGTGQDRDWFNSSFILELFIIAAVGFLAFIFWETTDKRPIVNLKMYAGRFFSVTMFVTVLAYGSMFGSIVLVPLWLQTAMGYTATWAGYNSAFSGITMVLITPFAGMLMNRIGPRAVTSLGLIITAASSLMRVGYDDQVTFWQLVWPQLVFGAGMMLTMIPLMEMSTMSLKEEDIASGAGQWNFVRTLGGAIATAAIVALWNHLISTSHASLTGVLHGTQLFFDSAQLDANATEQARGMLDMMVSGQSVMQATNNTFLVLAAIAFVGAVSVWFAPRPPVRTASG